MNHLKKWIVLACLLPTCSWAGVDLAMVQGEGDADVLMALYGDEEVISIATGSEKPLHLAPSVATVITSQQIRRMGATHLDQVLERVPGLHVAASNASRTDPVYAIRGIYSMFNPEVLVLMNGVRFPHLISGGRPQTFRMPIENIDRIEVIRGPVSALYGADAMSGVINIITKGSDQIGGTRMGVRVGSFDTYEGWIQHARQSGGWDLAMSMEVAKTNGDNGRIVEEDLQTVLDAAGGTNFSFAPGPLETANNIVNAHIQAEKEGWTFRLWSWTQQGGGQGDGAAQALDPVGNQDNVMLLADISHEQALTDALQLKLQLNYLFLHHDSYFQIFPSGVIGNPNTTDMLTGIESTLIYNGFSDHSLQLLGGYKYGDEQTGEVKNFGDGVTAGVMTDVTDTPYNFMPDIYNHQWYLAAQDEWQLSPDWQLTGGLRFDASSDVDGVFNPRLALVWSTLYNLTTKLMYGRAFRAPHFAELHIVNNPSILGNPDLDPETIETLELAFDYRPTLNLRTGLNLFLYRLEDQIDYVPNTGETTSTAQNANRVDGEGFEVEAQWQASDTLEFNANFAYQKSTDATTGQRSPYAPAWQFQTGVYWNFLPDWFLYGDLNWVGDRPRAEGDTRAKVDDYAIVDLTLRRKNLWNNFDAALIVRNLFDTEAYEPAPAEIPNDYPLEGLGIFGEIQYHFGSD
ncbi:MAG: TonB-dependent receptor [Magnetococcales bacterium]|nr:TonB-dependent receptor [Magnetococcales bacterium]